MSISAVLPTIIDKVIKKRLIDLLSNFSVIQYEEICSALFITPDKKILKSSDLIDHKIEDEDENLDGTEVTNAEITTIESTNEKKRKYPFTFHKDAKYLLEFILTTLFNEVVIIKNEDNIAQLQKKEDIANLLNEKLNANTGRFTSLYQTFTEQSVEVAWLEDIKNLLFKEMHNKLSNVYLCEYVAHLFTVLLRDMLYFMTLRFHFHKMKVVYTSHVKEFLLLYSKYNVDEMSDISNLLVKFNDFLKIAHDVEEEEKKERERVKAEKNLLLANIKSNETIITIPEVVAPEVMPEVVVPEVASEVAPEVVVTEVVPEVAPIKEVKPVRRIRKVKKTT
jgi:hypothetical protein